MRPAHPLPVLRPGDSGGRRLPGPPGRALRPERPPERVPSRPQAGLCPPGAGSLRQGIISQAQGRGRKPPELRVSEGESDTARALPTELKAGGRSRPEGGEGRRLSGPVPPVRPGSGPKTSGSLAPSILGSCDENCLAFKKTRLYWNRRPEQTLRCSVPHGMHSGGPRKLP